MARSRNIKPGASKNEVLAELGPMTQFLFVMLPCYADKAGRMEDRPKRIKAEIFPYYEADVDAMLQSLADCDEHFIIRYEIDGKRYLQITNFSEHQTPHHKEIESEIPPFTIVEPIKKQAQVKHKPSLPQAPVKGIRLKESGISIEESEEPEPVIKPFDRFWSAVHQKIGKRQSESAYEHAVKRLRVEKPDHDPHEFLLDRMTVFARSPSANPTDRAPIHPATWLNQGRYDDDPATWQRGSPRNGDPRGNLAVRNQLLAELEG